MEFNITRAKHQVVTELESVKAIRLSCAEAIRLIELLGMGPDTRDNGTHAWWGEASAKGLGATTFRRDFMLAVNGFGEALVFYPATDTTIVVPRAIQQAVTPQPHEVITVLTA